jgi:hypothetical protein
MIAQDRTGLEQELYREASGLGISVYRSANPLLSSAVEGIMQEVIGRMNAGQTPVISPETALSKSNFIETHPSPELQEWEAVYRKSRHNRHFCTAVVLGRMGGGRVEGAFGFVDVRLPSEYSACDFGFFCVPPAGGGVQPFMAYMKPGGKSAGSANTKIARLMGRCIEKWDASVPKQGAGAVSFDPDSVLPGHCYPHDLRDL